MTEAGKDHPYVRNLAMESPANCDKCNQPVEPINDATLLETIVEGQPGIIFSSRARHLLPTGICQGSPSRAQYLEGQPRDRRGYEYSEKYEPLYRAAYALMRAKYAGDPLPAPVLEFIMDNLGRGMRLTWREDERITQRVMDSEQVSASLREELNLWSNRKPERFTIKVGDHEKELDPIEYKLLKCLVYRRGDVVSHLELTQEVWGKSVAAYALAQVISRLRAKIEPNRKTPTFIHTILRQGYSLVDVEGKIIFPE